MKTVLVVFTALLTAFLPSFACGDIVYGSYVGGLQAHFEITDSAQSSINVMAGIAYDPTSMSGGVYDRLYLVNRSADNSKRGLYSVDMINQTSSSRLAMAGDSSSNDVDSPEDVTVDSSGNAYVCYIGTPSVWKVENPSGGSVVETKMLGNYSGSADDDPKALAMVPSGFGGSYTAGSDVLLFDGGVDDNAYESVTVIGAGSTDASPVYGIVFGDSDSSELIDGDPVADSSDYDGYAYLSSKNLFTANVASVGSESLAFVNRVNASGFLERVFLDLDMSSLASGMAIDDAVAVNPADGSLWVATGNGSDDTATHIFYRLDLANLTDLGGGDYLAATTAEITLTGSNNHNVATNAMTFSPDGKQLVVGDSDGVDNLYVYSIPEPATLVLLSLGGILLRKKK